MASFEDELNAELGKADAHPVLSAKEVEAAKAEARAAIEKERKANATKALIKDETERLKREEGLVSGDPIKDEMVNFTVDLPEYSGSITINMFDYWHGHTYAVPRHVANTLREIQQRTWAHQNEIDGKTTAQAIGMRRDTVISGVAGVKNAPQVNA